MNSPIDQRLTERGFAEVEHTADWALRIFGRDWPDFLKNAARGLNYLLIDAEAALVDKLEREERVALTAFDREGLLVDWLGELAYWAETERLIFHEFDFSEVTPTHLRARLRGSVVPHLRKHIKAVTYHNLAITEIAEGLTATVVFDV